MRNEAVFRIVLGAYGAVGTLVRLYSWRKASQAPQKMKQEERLRFALLVFFNALGWFGGLVYLIASRRMSWAALRLPTWSRWVGVGLGTAGAPLFLWIHHSLGKNYSVTVEIREQHTLVTSGPYRWVRHPMYTMFVVNGFAALLLSANWFIGGAWLGLGIVAASRVSDEEALMIEEFSEDYRSYMKRTGRFLPPLNVPAYLARKCT